MFLDRQELLATVPVEIRSSSLSRLDRSKTPFVGNEAAWGGGGLTIIEPVPKAVEPILYKIFRRSKVEPGIDCLRSVICQNAIWISRQVSRLSGGDEHS